MGGAIQAKGKGEEAAIGGSEIGDGSNLRKKKNKRKNKRYEKKNKSDEIEKEIIGNVSILPKDAVMSEVKGIEESANVSILPKDAVRSEIPGFERLDIGGGVRRNGHSNNRVRSGNKSNVSILPKDAVRSEVNVVEEIANVSILSKDAVRSEIPGFERLDIGGGVRQNGHSTNRVRSGYKSNVPILPKDSVRSEVNGVEEIANVSNLPKDEVRIEIPGLDIGGGVRRNGRSNNRVRSGYKSNVSILPKDSVRSEVNGVEEFANVSILPKDAVMSEIQDLEGLSIGRGVRRNGRSTNRVCSSNKSNVSILPKDVVRSEMKGVEETANVSILPIDAVTSEIPDLERLDIEGGFRRNGRSNNQVRSGNQSRTEYRVRVNRNEMKSVFEEESKPNVEPDSDRVVEGGSISDVRENGEKGIKYRRNRKSKENINGEIGRYGDRWKTKPRESGVMMWVKKEDKPAA